MKFNEGNSSHFVTPSDPKKSLGSQLLYYYLAWVIISHTYVFIYYLAQTHSSVVKLQKTKVQQFTKHSLTRYCIYPWNISQRLLLSRKEITKESHYIVRLLFVVVIFKVVSSKVLQLLALLSHCKEVWASTSGSQPLWLMSFKCCNNSTSAQNTD